MVFIEVVVKNMISFLLITYFERRMNIEITKMYL